MEAAFRDACGRQGERGARKQLLDRGVQEPEGRTAAGALLYAFCESSIDSTGRFVHAYLDDE